MCAIAQKRKSFPSKSYCVVENKGFYERCDLAEFNPFDKTHRPPCRRRAAHFVLVLAWVAFWINTALCPCCETLATTLDTHSDDVAESLSASTHIHNVSDSHKEQPDHRSDSPCGHAVNAEPTINSPYAGIPQAQSDLYLDAVYVNITCQRIALVHSATLAFFDYHPPPPYEGSRLYLQTQRLLI